LLRDVVRTFHRSDDGRRLACWIDLKVEGIGLDRALDDFWPLVARELRKLGVVPPSTPDSTSTQKLIGHVQGWLDEDVRRRILLLLDEADAFLASDARDDFRRSDTLKGLMERTERRFKVVFAGLHNVLRTTRNANHPLAHYGTPLCIGPLFS